jgi:hypothetical protein
MNLLLLWSIFLVILLKVIDSFTYGKDRRITIAAVAMPAITLINSALLTNILTHGLLLSLVILYLLPKMTKHSFGKYRHTIMEN